MKQIFLLVLFSTMLPATAGIAPLMPRPLEGRKPFGQRVAVRSETAEAGLNATHLSSYQEQEVAPPKVQIVLPGGGETFSWGTQVRYSINVSDKKDGESKYGEINPNEVLLEIEYLPLKKEEDLKAHLKQIQAREEPQGLSLIKKSTCFGCHMDKTKLAGPSFSQIAERYEPSAANIGNLADHIVKGTSGAWGDTQMPAHPDLAVEEAKAIAAFILEEGANKHRWISRGLEGAFRIMAKPADDSKGVYVLTASYTSHANVTGRHSVVLTVK